MRRSRPALLTPQPENGFAVCRPMVSALPSARVRAAIIFWVSFMSAPDNVFAAGKTMGRRVVLVRASPAYHRLLTYADIFGLFSLVRARASPAFQKTLLGVKRT